jgi:hypothetical protein
MKKYLKKIVIIIVILGLLYLIYLNNKKIDYLNQIIDTSQSRILNHYDNFKTMDYLIKLIEDNPSKENIKIAVIEISHYEHDIETLIELNRFNISNEVWDLYTNYRHRSQVQTYLLNLVLKKEEINKNELEKVKGILNKWKKFEDSMRIDVTSQSIVNIDSLVGSYIQLHKYLLEIMKN